MLFFSVKNKLNRKQTNTNYKKSSPPDIIISGMKKRASYAASLTVEAAFVIPMFMAGILALIFFLIAIQTQIRIQKALFNQTINMAGYAYYIGEFDLNDTAEDIAEAAAVKAAVINELGVDYLDNSYIVNGCKGLNLNYLSDKKSNVIDVALQYKMQVPFDLLGIGKISLVSRARAHTWRGDEGKNNVWDGEMVYMTTNGSVYHLYTDCTYLTSQVSSCSLELIETKRNADGERYVPCSRCCNEKCEGTVFYTKYGNRYHRLAICSNLVSNVYSIDKSEVIGKYPLCSKCMKRSDQR